MAPAAPVVLSINRAAPFTQYTSATSVTYAVTFDQPMTGVDASDFKVAVESTLTLASPVVVAGNGANYAVTIDGARGAGELRLDLIDDDSIVGGGLALGGAGANNGSFQGQIYSLLHAPYPYVVSINRGMPATAATNADTVRFIVTFSEPVTGVDRSDFQLFTNLFGPTLSQIEGSGSVYIVTVSGIAGAGKVGINLFDSNNSIRDLTGYPLAPVAAAAFQAQQTVATSFSPLTPVLGDVNGDGKVDLVVGNNGNSSVGVFLGNGDGTFQAQKTFAVSSDPNQVKLGDVNGDGKLDLAVANFGSTTVSVLLGNGDGAFQQQKTFATKLNPVSLAISDLNGDGRPDLAVANYSNASVSVLLGNGNGTFQPQVTYAVGTKPYTMSLGDVNGDGRPDLVVPNVTDNTVSVLLGNGNGTFQTRKTIEADIRPTSVTLADLNGDGKVDLSVTNSYHQNEGVFLGNGDGTFQAQRTFATNSAPFFSISADFNGDGKPDLAITNYGTTVTVLLGNGDGTFQARQAFSAGGNPRELAVGDLNGDGRPDLVVGHRVFSFVSVLLNNGIGNFSGQTYTVDTAGAMTTTTLTASPNASTGSTLVTFTATVAPSPGTLGIVTFKDNGVPLAGGSNIAVVDSVATFQTSNLPLGTHPITAEYSSPAGYLPSTSNTVNFVVAEAPRVVSVTVNGNFASLIGPQRSRVAGVVFAFDQPVQLDANAVTLALHTNNVTFNGVSQPAGFGTLPTSLNVTAGVNNNWLVTFAGNTENGADGFNSLKDGVYDLIIDATKVHPVGAPSINMAANSITTFHRLFGDIDNPNTPGGGTAGVDFSVIVNTGDNFAFRNAFNRPTGGGYVPYLDFDGSGLINTGDNLAFRNRFNRTLSWRV